jgi:hypothetical protein
MNTQQLRGDVYLGYRPEITPRIINPVDYSNRFIGGSDAVSGNAGQINIIERPENKIPKDEDIYYSLI